MKAIVYTQYGSPDVLRLEDVAKPTPKEGEVVVKVHAASVNALDWHFMRGTPRLMRAACVNPSSPASGWTWPVKWSQSARA